MKDRHYTRDTVETPEVLGNLIIAAFDENCEEIFPVQGQKLPFRQFKHKLVFNHIGYGDLRYNLSWDWLMPVVHKCLTICKAKMLNEWENQFTQSFKSLSLDEMYNTTISFINNIQE